MKLFFRKMGNGPPLLILHGLLGQSDNWMHVAKQLASHLCIYLLDLRNHGRSPHSDIFNFSVMVEDIYEFLTDLNLRRVNVLGHSMGGLTAMNFVSEYPHRVQKLIIIDIAPRPYAVLHEDIIDGLLSIDLKTLKSRKEADNQLAHFIEKRDIRQFLLKNLYLDDRRRWSWRSNLPVISEKLPEIGKGLLRQNKFEKPVLFIRGGSSPYITDHDIALIKDIYPKAFIETIPNATHWLHSEKPKELVAIINNFILNGESI